MSRVRICIFKNTLTLLKRVLTLSHMTLCICGARTCLVMFLLLGYARLAEARFPPYGYPVPTATPVPTTTTTIPVRDCKYNATSVCSLATITPQRALPGQSVNVSISFRSNDNSNFFYHQYYYGLEFLNTASYSTQSTMGSEAEYRVVMSAADQAASGSSNPSWSFTFNAPNQPGIYNLGYQLYYYQNFPECPQTAPIGSICQLSLEVVAPIITTTSTTTTIRPVTSSTTTTARSTTTTLRIITTTTTARTTTTVPVSITTSTTNTTIPRCSCGRKKKGCIPCPSPTPTPSPQSTPPPMPQLPGLL